MAALAVLREPSPEEASRWHKPRTEPMATTVSRTLECFEGDPEVRHLKRTSDGAELVLATPGGTTWRVRFGDDGVSVSLGPVLVDPNPSPDVEVNYQHDATVLLGTLQMATGFYVYSDELLGFEPVGECPGCRREVFEWQSACSLCDTPLHPLRPGEDAHDERAKRVLSALLRRDMIELVTPRGRHNVERVLAGYYSVGRIHVSVIHAFLVDLPDVAEVYCDESDLLQILARVQ